MVLLDNGAKPGAEAPFFSAMNSRAKTRTCLRKAKTDSHRHYLTGQQKTERDALAYYSGFHILK